MEVTSHNNYAGFAKRFFAFIIDYICIGLIIKLAAWFFHIVRVVSGVSGFHFFPFVFLFTGILYYAICESSRWQGTLGKRILNMKVISEQYQTLTTSQAIGRYLSKIISSLFFGLGFIWIIFDPKKQGWHDKLAKTYVIEV